MKPPPTPRFRLRSVASTVALAAAVSTFGAFAGPAGAAEGWWRLRVPEARADLWIELGAGRLWVAGDCDGGVAFDRFERHGDRLTAELAETLRADVGSPPLDLRQRLLLRVAGGEGTIELRGSATAAPVVLALTVEEVETGGPPGCTGSRSPGRGGIGDPSS